MVQTMGADSTSSAGTERISVSIIEDNMYVREGWQAALGTASEFRLLGSYPSCEAALEAKDFGDSQVVLMDIGLPGMSGIEGVREIHRRFPDSAIVMCTVHEDDQSVFDSLCAGAVGYLLKRDAPVQLIGALKDAYAGGSPMTPSIARKVLSSFHVASPSDSALSERERQVLDQMALGKSYAAIAHDLFLSVDGVRYHIRHIYEKLQVHSRAQAIAAGLKDKLIRKHR